MVQKYGTWYLSQMRLVNLPTGIGSYLAGLEPFYQSPLILTELFEHNLINVSYLTGMLPLSGLDDVVLFE